MDTEIIYAMGYAILASLIVGSFTYFLMFDYWKIIMTFIPAFILLGTIVHSWVTGKGLWS